MVTYKTWMRYLKYCNEKKIFNQSWNDFQQLPQYEKRKRTTWINRHHGDSILAFGPLRSIVLLDGIETRMDIYVTLEDINRNILLGDSVWKPVNIESIRIGTIDVGASSMATLRMKG